SLSMLRL
nr:myomodulin isoform, SLSMLRL amide [Lymnaea stagnalis, penis complex, Peptide, 7 aa] [Lymnaea stagnalis]